MPIISGGGGTLALARATLTDAQIKALPTTSIQLVAAPTSGQFIVPLTGVVFLDARGGAYTNLTSFVLGILLGSAQVTVQYVEAQQGAFADTSGVHVLAFFTADATGSPDNTAGWAAELTPPQPLLLTGDNGVNGNLTGGNAANSLTVDVLYHVLTL